MRTYRLCHLSYVVTCDELNIQSILASRRNFSKYEGLKIRHNIAFPINMNQRKRVK